MNIVLIMPYWMWLIISALFFAVGEFLSKKFALAPSFSYVVSIVLVYSLGVLSWLPAILQKNHLSVVGAMWSVLSLVATILIGTIVFDEKLSGIVVIGLALATVSVFLLSLS